MSNQDQPADPAAVTDLLEQAARGNREAFDRLFPLVYEELKHLAHGRLRFERPGHTLSTTALVHEAYFKLVGQTRIAWESRSQFFGVASEAMRRILIDYAKHRRRQKRGGGQASLPLEAAADRIIEELSDDEAEELIVLDEALHRLADFNPDGARVVQYRFYGGLTLEEIGTIMGTSERTARRAWTVARAWLGGELERTIRRPAGLLNPDAGEPA
jgi:RNA polymerase sigma factor (TIGR02999 family)